MSNYISNKATRDEYNRKLESLFDETYKYKILRTAFDGNSYFIEFARILKDGELSSTNFIEGGVLPTTLYRELLDA